ncbi:DUF350 domain-containing protein [Actinophytocola algeriensis]|jgi:uncharacterized membrane protein YjfL (UPF0719 family)|uniref:Uncharacterized membrane protein YjfL (UPF0719 family) n=1 Tax=Actinophytocola algeriensis TaxID=1768010 RepID=A0A7W7Q6U8_9PSEU|nr:DUF350 domain-containing protein [Actinophytocola algeriensis]MBB4908135.1 uncharacterized membrane protein YjfL (UPF0719 family) [Actinophytocola algeriensis]MBE1480165.1 uncharacterized membrane protein YjfL (UPF0719 family) [Actinophytocola algeriensis]
MVSDVFGEVGIAATYGLVGLVLMALGFVLVDVLTPGNLREQVWVQRNRNAAILLASNLLGVGIIVATAIAASQGNWAEGLLSTAAYGILGLVLMGVSFVVLDAVTPGSLGEVLMQQEANPAVYVNAASHISVSAIVAVAIF